MVELEATENETESQSMERAKEETKCFFKGLARQLVLFVSFGPGILGVLWLIGRILRR